MYTQEHDKTFGTQRLLSTDERLRPLVWTFASRATPGTDPRKILLCWCIQVFHSWSFKVTSLNTDTSIQYKPVLMHTTQKCRSFWDCRTQCKTCNNAMHSSLQQSYQKKQEERGHSAHSRQFWATFPFVRQQTGNTCSPWRAHNTALAARCTCILQRVIRTVTVPSEIERFFDSGGVDGQRKGRQTFVRQGFFVLFLVFCLA